MLSTGNVVLPPVPYKSLGVSVLGESIVRLCERYEIPSERISVQASLVMDSCVLRVEKGDSSVKQRCFTMLEYLNSPRVIEEWVESCGEWYHDFDFETELMKL